MRDHVRRAMDEELARRMTYAEAVDLLEDMMIGSTIDPPRAYMRPAFRDVDAWDVGPHRGLTLEQAAEALSGDEELDSERSPWNPRPERD